MVEYVRDELTLSWPTERIIGRVVIEGSAFPLGTVMMEGGRRGAEVVIERRELNHEN